MIASESTTNIATLQALSQSLDIPLLTFDALSRKQQNIGEIGKSGNNERTISVPNSDFHNLLTSHVVPHPSRGIVIYRARGRISYSEYFAIFQTGVTIYKDVLIGSDGDVSDDDVKMLKTYPVIDSVHIIFIRTFIL